MDWKHIFSFSPDVATEEEKDEVYNTITWYDIESEELSFERCKVLVKLSQEILKYKGEQVETLLHELDELATKQGEEDAAKRIESDTDGRSSKSRKSSSIELENLEQRYIELKTKYKKLLKINDRNTNELEKLRKEVSSLESDRVRLENELQLMRHDTQSDVSDDIKDQHKELIETVHNKNKQISDLLRDIEDIENDNSALREKLSNARDEMLNATKELKHLSEELDATKLQLKEAFELVEKLKLDCDILKDDLQDCQNQKQTAEKQLVDFTEEVNARIEEWKKILESKEIEIKKLKSQSPTGSQHSSSLSNISNIKDEETSVPVLSRALYEREKQLLEIQSQLQGATKDMEENAHVLDKLRKEKDLDAEKISSLISEKKNLKKQLKAGHQRCQELQDELQHAEKVAQEKTEDLKAIMQQLKKGDKVELAENLNQMQELKAQNRIHEKQIHSLVKSCNKLQECCDHLELENLMLREKLGIPEDDVIDVSIMPTKQRLQRKELLKVKNQLLKSEEETIRLKTEIQRLNRMLTSKENLVMEATPMQKHKSNGGGDADDVKLLIDENEALRKGLHDILNSVNVKKASSLTEIKSDTLEKLLRALDVKHISGWYHPAMRLQAELHNIEGINAELREQLRLARLEIDESKKSVKHEGVQVEMAEQRIMQIVEVERKENGEPPEKDSSDKVHILQDIMDKLSVYLKECGRNVPGFDEHVEPDEEIETDLFDLEKQLLFVISESSKHKEAMLENNEELTKACQDYQIQIEALQQKLTILSQDADEDVKQKADLASDNIILGRKFKYMESEVAKLRDVIQNMKNEALTKYNLHMNKQSKLTKNNRNLRLKIKTLERNLVNLKSSEDFNQVSKELDSVTIQYRQLLSNFEKRVNEKDLEFDLLHKTQKMLEEEKQELKSKLISCISKLSTCSCHELVDGDTQTLSKKLAESEVNEITERQRANHINNLYELVKEQLQKSEERFHEFEKYNKEILHKNLVLQEQLKEVEEKLISYVDVSAHEKLQESNNKLLETNQQLQNQLRELSGKKEVAIITYNTQNQWNSTKEQELLNLKHQIVDLQSICDDKSVIAQLSSDLLQLRLSENEWKTKCDILSSELQMVQEEWLGSLKAIDEQKEVFYEKETSLNNKTRILEEILAKQRVQYLGCVPLSSEEKFIGNLNQVFANKHASFLSLYNAQILENEGQTLKERLDAENQKLQEAEKILEGDNEELKKLLKWQQEKKFIELDLIKYRRQAEFRDNQLQQMQQRVQLQDEQIAKLEEELFLSYRNADVHLIPRDRPDVSLGKLSSPKSEKSEPKTQVMKSPIKFTKSEEVQTSAEDFVDNGDSEGRLHNLKGELLKTRNELTEKEESIQQLKNKITECEMNLSLFRKQIGDKQSQIMFYEKHIMELQSKKSDTCNKSTDGVIGGSSNNANLNESGSSSEDLVGLKNNIKVLEEKVLEKEEVILYYQSLLKEDRDKHSLAAARMQEELKQLRSILSEQIPVKAESPKHSPDSKRGKAAVEQYIQQVHALEKHMTELHTTVSTLDSQLQASMQEAVRWRGVANDRLEAMDKLRESLEERHQNEIMCYKQDSEKWREEVLQIKQLCAKYKTGLSTVAPDLQNLIREKDDKIHELTVMLRQAKTDANRKLLREMEGDTQTKVNDLEVVKEQLIKEHEMLKKRFEQLSNKERNAREEIKDLKVKLMKRPVASARSDKSDKAIKEQLQKKISQLEEEVYQLKQSLSSQITINESHRIRISEDFEKWKKHKQLQQQNEKLKAKLKETETELEKLRQTCVSCRVLIEKLEREKHNLEGRVKNLKSGTISFGQTQIELLTVENSKLMEEIDTLKQRLEMQQHHSGGLGAAMLQEKLEAQERKIANLELAAKGTVEVRAEIERLQNTISALQKSNLSLEAENLELKMDMGKVSKQTPHLREQIQHLESYIEVLKNENFIKEASCQSQQSSPADSKKVAELERTLFILKRVVEKLQAENKRLLSGKPLYSDRTGSADKLRQDNKKLREQYGDAVHRINQLEVELATCKNKLTDIEKRNVREDVLVLKIEVEKLKSQLAQKNEFLEKVKTLLHRAAEKEKSLLREIADLKLQTARSDDIAISSRRS